ncbi:hypothetical protein R4Y59_002685 [Enterococcus faecalis]|nr:hypothetical protein [Enterococcus faecalis]
MDKDLKNRAEIIAKIYNQSLDDPENDRSFIFTELIDDEFLRNDISFEEALEILEYAIHEIKSQKPRTKEERLESVLKRSNEYERSVYLIGETSSKRAFIENQLK